MIKSSNDNPAVDTVAFKSALAAVNTIFAPIKVSFSLCEVRYIDNYNYDTINDQTRKEALIKYQVANRINIFLVSSLAGTECGNADLGGILRSKQVGIFLLRGSCLNATTLAHELGHYFSLGHTFGNTGSRTTETANGSNCEVAGDGICDTPADPYVIGDNSLYINSDCVFINSSLKDSNGDYYDPDVSNIMSYYFPCICNKFTWEQYEKMASYYLENPFIW
jgi:hypothetical protein